MHHILVDTSYAPLAKVSLPGTQRVFYCSYGKNGVSSAKQEGDKKTPLGLLMPVGILYRVGRVIRPKSFLPVQPITYHDGWCDDVKSMFYNRAVFYPSKDMSKNISKDITQDVNKNIVSKQESRRLNLSHQKSALLNKQSVNEYLWRDDHLYDLVIILDYNFPAVQKNKGSAVFIHIMHSAQKPTLGCLGFLQKELQYIIHHLKPSQGFLIY